MKLLVITDIPRLTTLFEQLGVRYSKLKVASDIESGIALLKRDTPELILFQNHLSGLSAGIIHKHLLQQLDGKVTGFGLISQPQGVDPDTAALFQEIIDPSGDDMQISEGVIRLFQNRAKTDVVKPFTFKEAVADEERQPEPEPPVTTRDEVESPSYPPTRTLLSYSATEPLIELPDSGFGQELEQRSDNLYMGEGRIRGGEIPFEQAEEPQQLKQVVQHNPPLRRNLLILLSLAVFSALLLTLYQHKNTTGPANAEKETTIPDTKQAASSAQQQPTPFESSSTHTRTELASHGKGRPRQIPAFIPQDDEDKGFAKDNPGWLRYRGKTVEYRVFKSDDGGIKAIQLLDLGGTGIQEGYYKEIIKSLSGSDTMRTASSETKEGYEIRRGELAGLQLVQYRDAAGGRLRGVVITWP